MVLPILEFSETDKPITTGELSVRIANNTYAVKRIDSDYFSEE
jgi:hypothetical protein